MKYTYRNRDGKTYVTIHGDFDYNTLVQALLSKYPDVRITSGGAYTSVTGVLDSGKREEINARTQFQP